MFALFCPALFPDLSMPFLALPCSNTVPRVNGTGNGSESARMATSCSLLVYHLHYSLSGLKLANFSVHYREYFSVLVARKKVKKVISKRSDNLSQALGYLGTHLGYRSGIHKHLEKLTTVISTIVYVFRS